MPSELVVVILPESSSLLRSTIHRKSPKPLLYQYQTNYARVCVGGKHTGYPLITGNSSLIADPRKHELTRTTLVIPSTVSQLTNCPLFIFRSISNGSRFRRILIRPYRDTLYWTKALSHGIKELADKRSDERSL